MKRRLGIIAVGVTLLMSTAALAQSPRWTFVEAGYMDLDPDVGDSADGWFVGGNFGLKDLPVHFLAQYNEASFSGGDTDAWLLGGGWHGLLGDRADLLAELAYGDRGFDPDGGGSFSESFWTVRAGVRWLVLPILELDGFVARTEPDDSDSFTDYEVDAIFQLKRIGLGIGYNVGDDVDTAKAFVRWNFR